MSRVDTVKLLVPLQSDSMQSDNWSDKNDDRDDARHDLTPTHSATLITHVHIIEGWESNDTDDKRRKRQRTAAKGLAFVEHGRPSKRTQ